MLDFQTIALSPAGLDPAIAIAASRAGALGILNLEYEREAEAARQAIALLVRFATAPIGIKLSSGNAAFVEAVLADLPAPVTTVLFTATDADLLGKQVASLSAQGRTVLLEVTSLQQAHVGESLGVDGLVAKGHEAGGWVGEETTFILLQHLISQVTLPVWAFGGIGLHTAAACFAAGAAGVVLSAELSLARESQLPEPVKRAISMMDGSETLAFGGEMGQVFRAYSRPGAAAVDALSRTALDLVAAGGTQANWRDAVEARVGWGALQSDLWPLGQDASFAASLAQRFHTVSGILKAVQQAVREHVLAAQVVRPLDAGGPLAQAHGTRYPIVQGPMTRVSDRAEFCFGVAQGGGLPFLALALMRANAVDALLAETRQKMGNLPWGVGILGFVPLDLREEQFKVILDHRPPYAIIAGGRPDQAQRLEAEGIATYLHVPSPGLLKLFLKDGARRFIFEGRECGGHVGPRSSFVLWNAMIDVILDELPAGEAEDCYVLFAGGVHDRLSAAMVAAMAAPLAERGVRVGVLMGTAYLFTEEAVSGGAILPAFQQEAIRCEATVLLESGPGHATRCAPSPFVEVFEQEKLRLRQEGKHSEDVRQALEELNIGRLRIASKGVNRHPRYGQEPDVPRYLSLSEEEQRRDGMYMIGQVASLRDQVVTVEALHSEVAVEGTRLLARLSTVEPAVARTPAIKPSEVAIIGISALLPKAPNAQAFWENILNGVYAIGEVPKDRWDWELYFDADRSATDKVYSRWGGFIDDVPFDPLEFGMPPNSLPSIDPMHLLALVATREALKDAGLDIRPFDRSRTSVILGASGGVGDLGAAYVLRSGLPMLFGEAGYELAKQAGDALPEWTEDSFAGLLLNVAAGRIANRFDFGGLNYVVDAACASSLTAVHLAVKELETYNTDVAIAGGVDTVQNPFGYLCFSKTQALTPSGRPRTFDAAGDGIAISEGVVMLVLKRLADAERDGDRVYAVIQGVGGSSDGRALGMTAPRPEGQVLALQRAYAKAGFSPTTVGLFEAHGTGTAVGDRTEALSLGRFLEEAGADPAQHAVGSVKSMIGHTKASAGVASVAKAALALYHKVLPATLGVTQPNPKARFGEGPLYVNAETRPWLHSAEGHPRRAGVSAFGFGGTNFHAVLEEYTGDFLPLARRATAQRWASELLVWAAPSRQGLLSQLSLLEQALEQGATPSLHDLAYTLWQSAERGIVGEATGAPLRLALVVESLDDLRQKVAVAREALARPEPFALNDPRGLFGSEQPLAREGKIAFLFPGQGSQTPNMLRDLALHFAEVRETFERADRVLEDSFHGPLSRLIFPTPAFTPEEERAQREALTQTDVAQPALGAADSALFHLLQTLEVRPDFVAGHSYGEYVALYAAGVIDESTLAHLSEARGRSIVEAAESDLGTMAAVRADAATIAPLIQGLDGVWLANLNSPKQTILSGTRAGVAAAIERLKGLGHSAQPIPVAAAFHSPLVAPAQARLAAHLEQATFRTATATAYSNTTAAPYPQAPHEVAALLAEHLVRPVRFQEQIEAMYEAGARLFVEVGPKTVLTGLTGQILGERPHVAVATDLPGRPGLMQLQYALGQLIAHGVPVRLDRLFQGRGVRRLNMQMLVQDTQPKPLAPTTWLVNGGRARPMRVERTPRRPPLAGLLAQAKGHAASNGQGSPKSLPLPNGTALNGAVNGNGHVAASNGSPAPMPQSLAAPAPSMGIAPAPAPSQPAPRAAAAPAPAPSGTLLPASDEAEQVLDHFQRLMGSFLDTQQAVMLSFLHDAPPDPQGEGYVDAQLTRPAPLAEAPVALSLPPVAPPVAQPQPAAAPPPVEASLPLPPIVPAPAPAAPQAAPRSLGREALTSLLLDIVGERTGYPAEMLELDQDLEANLGIDSIKRVEILGRLRQALPAEAGADKLDMEGLAGLKTLREIVERLTTASPAVTPSNGWHGDSNEKKAAPPVNAPAQAVGRFTIQPVERPLLGLVGTLAPGGVVILTDDGGDVAQALAAQIERAGHPVALIRALERHTEPGDSYLVDLTSSTEIHHMLRQIQGEKGPIAALIHLLPLRAQPSFAAMDLADWQQALQQEVRGLFLLAQALQPDLEAAAGAGGAALIAGQRHGGHLCDWRLRVRLCPAPCSVGRAAQDAGERMAHRARARRGRQPPRGSRAAGRASGS